MVFSLRRFLRYQQGAGKGNVSRAGGYYSIVRALFLMKNTFLNGFRPFSGLEFLLFRI